jgi:predicted GNAT family acetyltransferase
MVAQTRLLVGGDEAELFRFLERYLDTSLFFFSNIELAGLEYRGENFQATYVASFDSAGRMTAVAGHAWNGNVMLQGDAGLEAAALTAVEIAGRDVKGLVGPWSLACRARRALGLDGRKAAHEVPEVLYTLSLDELRVPALLAQPDIALRAPSEAEAGGMLAAWRSAYMVESLGSEPGPELDRATREQMLGWRESGRCYVLTQAERIVAMTGFNAIARGAAQVGGVYTPPELRSRGYARAAVAGSLQLARQAGATRSVLFTAQDHVAARKAYAALGYREAGDFGLILF